MTLRQVKSKTVLIDLLMFRFENLLCILHSLFVLSGLGFLDRKPVFLTGLIIIGPHFGINEIPGRLRDLVDFCRRVLLLNHDFTLHFLSFVVVFFVPLQRPAIRVTAVSPRLYRRKASSSSRHHIPAATPRELPALC